MNFLNENWSLPHKIFFRFLAIYLALYMFPFPFTYIPGVEWLLTPYSSMWDMVVPWVGKNIVGLSYTVSLEPSGSGDKTYDYIYLLIIFSVSLTAAAIWSLADWRRSHYARLQFWLTIWARYYLGAYMMIYGFVKIFKTQFPFPSLDRLLEPYGDSSPMGLVWTFMGYSPAYNMFTGLGEAIGGILLLFRRTTTLGALILIVVLSNVVMINFAYDVPVKLFSAHLLLVAILLLIPDAKRLLQFFILNKPTAPADYHFAIDNKNLKYGRAAAKTLIIGFLLYTNISGGYENEYKWGDKKKKPPLYGIYDVDTYVVNGDTIPPLLTDPDRWKQMVVSWENYLTVKTTDDKRRGYASTIDTIAQTLDLKLNSKPSETYSLMYKMEGDDDMILEGLASEKDTIFISMKKRDLNSFLLVNRGYHWINEYPFNR